MVAFGDGKLLDSITTTILGVATLVAAVTALVKVIRVDRTTTKMEGQVTNLTATVEGSEMPIGNGGTIPDGPEDQPPPSVREAGDSPDQPPTAPASRP